MGVNAKKWQKQVEELHQIAKKLTREQGERDWFYEAVQEVESSATSEAFTGKDVPLEILQQAKSVKVHFYCGKLTVFFETHAGETHLITHLDSYVLQTGDSTIFRTGQPGILYTWRSSELVADERQGWFLIGKITDKCFKVECEEMPKKSPLSASERQSNFTLEPYADEAGQRFVALNFLCRDCNQLRDFSCGELQPCSIIGLIGSCCAGGNPYPYKFELKGANYKETWHFECVDKDKQVKVTYIFIPDECQTMPYSCTFACDALRQLVLRINQWCSCGP